VLSSEVIKNIGAGLERRAAPDSIAGISSTGLRVRVAAQLRVHARCHNQCESI